MLAFGKKYRLKHKRKGEIVVTVLGTEQEVPDDPNSEMLVRVEIHDQPSKGKTTEKLLRTSLIQEVHGLD